MAMICVYASATHYFFLIMQVLYLIEEEKLFVGEKIIPCKSQNNQKSHFSS